MTRPAGPAMAGSAPVGRLRANLPQRGYSPPATGKRPRGDWRQGLTGKRGPCPSPYRRKLARRAIPAAFPAPYRRLGMGSPEGASLARADCPAALAPFRGNGKVRQWTISARRKPRQSMRLTLQYRAFAIAQIGAMAPPGGTRNGWNGNRQAATAHKKPFGRGQ